MSEPSEPTPAGIFAALDAAMRQGTLVPALANLVGLLAEELANLAEAAVAYDEAILACANDPSLMSTATTADGETLDDLYLDLMRQARTVLGLPNHLGELEAEPIPPEAPAEAS